jgi:hypothetical protein
MPKITDNEDGTMSFSLNSAELTGLFDQHVPDLRKAVRLLDSPDVKATLNFLKSAVS